MSTTQSPALARVATLERAASLSQSALRSARACVPGAARRVRALPLLARLAVVRMTRGRRAR